MTIQIIEKLTNNVWKVKAHSNIYYIDFGKEKIIIDSGRRTHRREVELFLGGVIDLKQITKVIFTHLHYDHIGNFDLFSNAKFYASEREIQDYKNSNFDAILDKDMADKFSRVDLNPLNENDKIEGLKVITTPGHTAGSICLFYEEEGILFSGDTIFDNKILGRTDLPTSMGGQMDKTIMKLAEMNYKMLCPGHDY